MSSTIILERSDNYNLSKSYIRVYKTNTLYKMKNHYRKTILRIVKKSILGTNFIYFYSKHGLFISAIFNIVIVNLNFLLFPQLLYKSKFFNNYSDEKEINNEINNISPDFKVFHSNKFIHIIFRIFIINLLDVLVLSVLTISFKFKQKKINKYMEQYTQFSIESENNFLNKNYNCNISKDGKFNIEIKSIKNINDRNLLKNNNNIFFEYVINLPNIRFFSNYIYKKIFSPVEKEIIDRIVAISNEIEYKYKKKLLTFLLIIISVIIYIPLKNFLFEENKKDFINYFGILILMLFVERNNFFKNKNEQIQRVSNLNYEYINNGSYIYINNEIISIFYVKENYRNKESIDKIKEINERLLYKSDLI